jgi:hypothetical protein
VRGAILSLPGILLIAFAARALWALAVPSILFSDPGAYDTLARNIAEHGVYGWDPETPTAFWAVGAAAIYGGLYAVTGPSLTAAVALNIAVSLAIVWLTVSVTAQWLGSRAGLLAGLFVALWPALIQFVNFPNSELFFTALLLAALRAWTSAAGLVPRGAATGLLLGAATLVRPVALLVPIVLTITGRPLGGGPGLRARLGASLVAFLCIGAVVAPWSLRNHAVFGEVVLVSTNFGPNLWMGNNPDTTGRYQALPDRVATMGEIARDETLKAEAFDYIRSDPAAFARRFFTKIVYMFGRETTGVTWNSRGIEARYGPAPLTPLKAVSTAYWYAMLALALAGLARLARLRGVGAALFCVPVALVGYFATVHGVIFVSDRFHIPLNPLLAALAAFALLGAPGRAEGARA